MPKRSFSKQLKKLSEDYLPIARRFVMYVIQGFVLLAVLLAVVLFVVDLWLARGSTRQETVGGFHVGTNSVNSIQDTVVFLTRPTFTVCPQSNKTFTGSFFAGFGLWGEGGSRVDEVREWLATADLGTFYVSTPANTVGSPSSGRVESVFPMPSGSQVVEEFLATRPPELVEDNALGVLGLYRMPADAAWRVLSNEGFVEQSFYSFRYDLETGPMWTETLGIGRWKFDINIKPHSFPTFVADLGSSQTLDRESATYLDGPELEVLLCTKGTGLTFTELTPRPDVSTSTMARWRVPLGANLSIKGVAEGGMGRWIVDYFWPIIVSFAIAAVLAFTFSRSRSDKESDSASRQ
jgi:hypothetical protein